MTVPIENGDDRRMAGPGCDLVRARASSDPQCDGGVPQIVRPQTLEVSMFALWGVKTRPRP
jgi:hypothetical protein